MEFWIHDNRFPEPPRCGNDGAGDALGERTLGVVGQHHRTDFGHRRFRMGDDRGFGFCTGRFHGLPIGPHQVGRVVLRHVAHLARRLPCPVDHQVGDDRAELGERSAQCAAGLVVADQPDEYALRPERGDVARDVASAADLDRVVRHLQNRRRRLRRNPRDFAVDEIVEHDVADAKNGLLRNQP